MYVIVRNLGAIDARIVCAVDDLDLAMDIVDECGIGATMASLPVLTAEDRPRFVTLARVEVTYSPTVLIHATPVLIEKHFVTGDVPPVFAFEEEYGEGSAMINVFGTDVGQVEASAHQIKSEHGVGRRETLDRLIAPPEDEPAGD